METQLFIDSPFGHAVVEIEVPQTPVTPVVTIRPLTKTLTLVGNPYFSIDPEGIRCACREACTEFATGAHIERMNQLHEVK